MEAVNMSDSQPIVQPEFLRDKWVLYAHLPHDTDWSMKSYKVIHEISTVDEIIALFNVIPEKLVHIAINLELKFFGCDLPSVDESGSSEKPVHNALLKSDIIIYETLTNLNELPMLKPFSFFGFPLAFTDLDGSPVRAGAYI